MSEQGNEATAAAQRVNETMRGGALVYEGKTVLITGGTSGLGLAVARRFAKAGANTIVVCRTEASGRQAVAEIEADAPNGSLDLMSCDLASMASINRLLGQVKATYPSLDLVFNNAAVMKRERTVTADGFEMMFQVNYLAPFIVMKSLLEQLRGSPTALLLNNGRPSAKLRLDFDDLQSADHYRMYDSFFRTKLCLLLTTIELARRPEGAGLSIHMADPGPFKSALVREAPWPAGWVKNLFSATVDDAADNILSVAESDEALRETGKVFKKRRAVTLAPYWQDAETRQTLWEATETMLDEVERG